MSAPAPQQHIDGRPIAPLHRREQRVLAEAVIGQRIVDLRPQLRMLLEKLADARCIAVAHCRLQRLGRTEPQRLNVRLQLRPGGEAVLIGQRMLRVRQFALPHAAQQFFGLFLEIFEIWFFR